jgi:translation initiation factor 4G
MAKNSDPFLPDNRDWVDRSPLPPTASEETLGENREYGAEPALALVKAYVPRSARRGAMSEKDGVLKAVMGILNKLTPEKFDVLKDQLINSGINSADILQGVKTLVFERAVSEPLLCPMYAKLCQNLSTALPQFPSKETNGKPIAFRRILLDTCQEAFEGANNLRAEIKEKTAPDRAVKLRSLGNIRFMGELFKQKMVPEKIVHDCIQHLLGPDMNAAPAEENVEALCLLFNTVGKQLEGKPKSRRILDSYFVRMEQVSNNQHFESQMRFMVGKVLDLRANKWIPRHDEMKPKTINKIHSETGRNLDLNPRTTNVRNIGAGNSFGIRRDAGGRKELRRFESVGTKHEEKHKLVWRVKARREEGGTLKETEASGATVTTACDTGQLWVGGADYKGDNSREGQIVKEEQSEGTAQMNEMNEGRRIV